MSLTITFHNIDNPQRSVADLQLFLIFCHLSASNSRAKTQGAYMRMINYLDNYVGGAGKKPFDIIKKIIDDGKLDQFVKQGIHASRVPLTKKFFQSIVANNVDVQKVSREDLIDKIHGIGPAKAAMFVAFRDQNWQSAALDRNVQRWMREQFNELGLQNKAREIPLKTPDSRDEYKKLEAAFLELAAARKLDPRDLTMQALRATEGETQFDRADEKRIKKGGKRYASHWDSRISRNDISLPL